jgi:hypothetical protein
VAHHDGVAVGRRLRHLPGGHGAGRAWPVLDHHRLAEKLGHARREDARHHVGAAAGREAHDHADRLAGIVLRLRGACEQQRPEKESSHRMQL